jgi:hypothetical protein
MLNLNGKTFRSLANTSNGEVSSDTVFHYHQEGAFVWADYGGGGIIQGRLMGTLSAEGILTMKYLHRNGRDEIMTGECVSTPAVLPDGRIRFHESWRWTSGDFSSGESVIEEV